MQNKVANLERQVLEAKKVVLWRQLQIPTAAKPAPPIEEPTVNSTETRTSNFGSFYEHKDEKSHLVPHMREYRFVDIRYTRDIMKNKFKPENIMKLSTSIRRIREVAKTLKIGTSSLKTKAKDEDCATANAKCIILLLRAFYLYAQILFFLAALGNKLQFQLALGKYDKHLMIL